MPQKENRNAVALLINEFNSAASSQNRCSGALQHIIIRGIERQTIFKNDTDRADFIDRSSLSRALGWVQADPALKNMSKALRYHRHPGD